jgi:hypothetical protein
VRVTLFTYTYQLFVESIHIELNLAEGFLIGFEGEVRGRFFEFIYNSCLEDSQFVYDEGLVVLNNTHLLIHFPIEGLD